MSMTSTYASVVISPATMHWPVVTSVSQATRALGSLARMASRIASEIWSATLSGWPIETDSLEKRCVLRRNWEDTLVRLRGKEKNAGCRAPFGASQAGVKNVADGGIDGKKWGVGCRRQRKTKM